MVAMTCNLMVNSVHQNQLVAITCNLVMIVDLVNWNGPSICPNITPLATASSISARSFLGCYCNSSCEIYDDCCINYDSSSSSDSSHSLEHSHKFECVNIRPILANTIPEATDKYILVISSCPASWLDTEHGTHTASICSSYDGLLPPATDLSTNITYKNLFCAICHGISNVSMWSLELKGSNEAENMTRMNITEVMKEFEVVSFVEPITSIAHKCFSNDVIRTCPSYELSGFPTYDHYSSVVHECSRYQQVVEADSVLYRNKDCALCNGKLKAKVYLTEDCLREMMNPFNISTNVTGPLEIFTISVTFIELVIVLCSEEQVFDEEAMSCRDIFLEGVDILDSSSGDQIEFVNDTLTGLDNNGCENGTLIALNESEFEFIGDNVVIFNGELLEVQLNTTEGLPVVCVNFSENGTIIITRKAYSYPIGYDYITYVGCSLSLVGCFLVLLSFCLFKELRTLPSKILINITITIIGVDILTLLTVGRASQSSKLCQTLAISLHFFTLAQFTWMTVCVLRWFVRFI